MRLYAITLNAIFTSQQLKLNPLDLTDSDLVFGPVVKFGCPGRLMRSHLLGMLEPAAILQVNRGASSAPGVTPDRRQKPSVPRSFANGCPGIEPIQRSAAQRGACLVYALEQRCLSSIRGLGSNGTTKAIKRRYRWF